jgi:hypothetical protein
MNEKLVDLLKKFAVDLTQEIAAAALKFELDISVFDRLQSLERDTIKVLSVLLGTPESVDIEAAGNALVDYNKFAGTFTYGPVRLVRTEDELNDAFRACCTKHGLIAPDLSGVTLRGIELGELGDLFNRARYAD